MDPLILDKKLPICHHIEFPLKFFNDEPMPNNNPEIGKTAITSKNDPDNLERFPKSLCFQLICIFFNSILKLKNFKNLSKY
jgi:hypothetical protein